MLGVTIGVRRRRLRGVTGSVANILKIPITNRATTSLAGWRRPVCTLGVLKDGSVAEIILFGGLDAEGALCSHAPHRLAYVQRPDILQLWQTDVQSTKRT